MSRTLHVPDLKRAFDHGERLGIEEVAPLGVAKQLDEIVAIGRLAANDLPEPVNPRLCP